MFYRDGFIRSRTFDLDKLAFAPFVVLSETTGVDLTTTGTTDLYTIPSGQTPIILGTISRGIQAIDLHAPMSGTSNST